MSEKDETMNKVAVMVKTVHLLMGDGHSRVEAEKLSQEWLDEFLAKRYYVDDSSKKKGNKDRKKSKIQEQFEELLRQKIFTRRG